MTERLSRIERARHRAAGAKQIAVAAAAAGFLAIVLLARGSHPGQASTSSGSSGTSQSSSDSSSNQSSDLGSGSIAPSAGNATPQAQTSVS